MLLSGHHAVKDRDKCLVRVNLSALVHPRLRVESHQDATFLALHHKQGGASLVTHLVEEGFIDVFESGDNVGV